MGNSKKPKKIKLDMSGIQSKLIEKTVKNPYWGTGLSGGVNVSDKD